VTVARAIGWLWLGHAAAAVVAFVWLGIELALIFLRFDVARDGIAQIGAFFAGYFMFIAAALAVLGWKLGRFALGGPGSVLVLAVGTIVFHVMPLAVVYVSAFGAAPPSIARPVHGVILFEAAVALVTLAWLATLRRAA
jgi:hypothetical protein